MSEPDDSAQTRISAALEAGTIDYPASLVYRTYALFGDPQLPAEYLAPGIAEDGSLFDEIQVAESELPAGMRENLASYTVRPDNPASIHSQPMSGHLDVPPLAVVGELAQAPGDEAVMCGANGWATLSSAKGFKVWSLCTGDYVDQVRFAFDAMDSLWDREIELMGKPVPDAGGLNGGGDSAIDVYLLERWQCIRRDQKCTDTNIAGKNGEYYSALGVAPATDPKTGPLGARTASGYILLTRQFSSGEELGQTLAHELFHVLQHAHNWEGKFNGGPLYHWLTESSAQWAGWYFARSDADSSRARFEQFMKAPAVSLNLRPTKEDRRYKAWVWHLFRQLESGGPQFMAETWRAVEGKKDQAAFDKAMDGAYSFAGHFRDFAVKNVNIELDPGDPISPRYAGLDEILTEGAAMPEPRQLSGSPPGDFPATWPVTIAPLSASYQPLLFDDDVRQIRLDLSGVQPADNLDADLLILLPSGWERRKASLGKTKFCRDLRAEDVSEMYVVLSNHGFLPDASPITGAVQLQPLMAGCLGGHGTATIKREQNGTYTSSRGNPTKLVHSDTARITFDLEPDEFDPSVLNATSATVTWELTETQTETFDDCVEVTESTGSGGWSADNGPGVMYGWSAPDGTLFGMVPDESKYVFEAVPPVTDIPTDDLRVAYESSTTGCGITLSGLRVPFTTLAYADAPMPTDPTTLSGTYQRTMQGGLLLVPMQVTVVWNISLVPAGSP